MSSPLPTGALNYLTSVNANMHIYAVVTDPTVPNLNTITINVNADEATAIVPGLIGQTGPAGEPQFVLNLQPDIYSSPASLPTGLTGSDFGKYWLIVQDDSNGNPITSAAYIWWGSSFRVVPFGTTGPVGPVPQITPDVILIDPNLTSYVQNTGTVGNPSWTYYLAVPAGPQGPASTLAGCVDVNESVPPTIGQVLGFNGIYTDGLPTWQPMTVGAMNPLPYTVPESAFVSYSGISSSPQTICTFAIPPNPWPWKPVVMGQVEVFGISISLTPLLIDVEILLGDPTSGTLVGRGYGNDFGGAVTILPQTSSGSSSSSSTASAAMTPGNSTALVPANHTGSKGTLYVNLVNSGMASLYDYSAANSQLFVMCIPIGGEGAVNAAVYGSLTCKVTLSAWSVVKSP
jgi:hypothetical protein